MQIHITHWLPIITFCPVNAKMDWLYCTVTFDFDERQLGSELVWFPELYTVRRQMRKLLWGRKIYMEDAAVLLKESFPLAKRIRVALMFNRHVVELT